MHKYLIFLLIEKELKTISRLESWPKNIACKKNITRRKNFQFDRWPNTRLLRLVLCGKGRKTMSLVSTLILIAAGLVYLIYTIKILVLAFKSSVWWGLGSIFIPFCIYLYVALNWPATKRAVLLSLLIIPLTIIGMYLQPSPYEQLINRWKNI